MSSDIEADEIMKNAVIAWVLEEWLSMVDLNDWKWKHIYEKFVKMMGREPNKPCSTLRISGWKRQNGLS